jgi:alpha-L-fucosidase
VLNSGNPQGERWVPGEADVSIRPGWFYSPTTDDRQKSVAQLLDIYYSSVGRNANLLLNVPPDRSGRIHPKDSIRLMEFRQAITKSFQNNLLAGASAKVTSHRGDNSRFAAKRLIDGDYDTYWATDDSVLTASVEFNLKVRQSFNRLVLQEYIPLGQRVEQFSVEYQDRETGIWSPLTQGTTIGYKRILSFPSTIAQCIRINILRSLACPALNNVELYDAEPSLINNQ